MDTVEDHESLPVMKEGRVEKKGTQGLAMFNWQGRWLKIRANELAYYREDDRSAYFPLFKPARATSLTLT